MTVDRWDQRQLCADGSCIGVIGPDGTCKMCGRAAPNWGDERKRGLVDEPDEAGEPTEEPAAEKRPLVSVSARPGKPAEWNTRQLCSDGGCIGVIGDDGKCKLCGKPAGNVEESEDDYEDDDDLDASADGEDDEYEDDDDEYEDDDEPDDDAAASGSKPAVASASEPAKSAAPLGALEIEDEANRKLCPDGACVGVIGADGKCKICGKDAA